MKPNEVALELLKLAKSQEDKKRVEDLIKSLALSNSSHATVAQAVPL